MRQDGVRINKAPPKRSAGALKSRRVQLPWPEDRDLRILTIDGGGIRGIFPAAFLAGLEERYLNGSSITDFFDLISGTSTGGIISIGLGAGLRASEMRDLYVDRGDKIFPPSGSGLLGSLAHRIKNCYRYFKFRYDRDALALILDEILSEQKFGDSRSRLCIPSFEGRYGEPYIFKTPHHPDFRKDGLERMAKVALATAAAPTYFQPLEDGGYTFVDGGVWANNPIMVALVDALTCFSVPRERIHILSLGCGSNPYIINRSKVLSGGIWAWRDIVGAAIRLQSANALGQAGLLIGANRVIRIDVPPEQEKIELDDWLCAMHVLPNVAEAELDRVGQFVATKFLSKPAHPYRRL